MTFEQLSLRSRPTFFTNWHDNTNFPDMFGSGIYIPGLDANSGYILYLTGEMMYSRYKCVGTWRDWKRII